MFTLWDKFIDKTHSKLKLSNFKIYLRAKLREMNQAFQ